LSIFLLDKYLVQLLFVVMQAKTIAPAFISKVQTQEFLSKLEGSSTHSRLSIAY
jgi:hypothetical protein